MTSIAKIDNPIIYSESRSYARCDEGYWFTKYDNWSFVKLYDTIHLQLSQAIVFYSLGVPI